MNSSIVNLKYENDMLCVSFVPEELNLFNIDSINQAFKKKLKTVPGSYSTIYMKMDNIKSIDSSSVAFLVRAHLDAKKQKKKLILKDIPETLYKTLDFANLLNDFEVQ